MRTVAPVWGCVQSGALWIMFSTKTFMYLAAFILSSILTSLPVLSTEKHPHSMMLPPPCFTIGMVLAGWWAVLVFTTTTMLHCRDGVSQVMSSARCSEKKERMWMHKNHPWPNPGPVRRKGLRNWARNHSSVVLQRLLKCTFLLSDAKLQVPQNISWIGQLYL